MLHESLTRLQKVTKTFKYQTITIHVKLNTNVVQMLMNMYITRRHLSTSTSYFKLNMGFNKLEFGFLHFQNNAKIFLG